MTFPAVFSATGQNRNNAEAVDEFVEADAPGMFSDPE